MSRGIRSAVLLVLGAVLLLTGESGAQMPLHRRVMTMIKDGKMAEPVMMRKQNELAKRGIDAPWTSDALTAQNRRSPSEFHRLFGPERVPAGSLKALLILVQFSDKPSQVSASRFDTLIFGAAAGTVRDYYREVSNGVLDIVTVNLPGEIGWVTAPQSYSYYVNSDNGFGRYPNNAQKLVEDAANAVDGVVDFSQYDNDGDGYVDALFIAHAGSGAEFTGSANDIWSHSWTTYTAQLHDGVNVYRYAMEPEYWQTPGDMTCGVFCHELGHALFGLPDLYDIDYTSFGLGMWSLMAFGCWTGPLEIGESPSFPDAWSRFQMGYGIEQFSIVSDERLGQQIRCAEKDPVAYRLWTGGASGLEYFLVENRQQIGYDTYLPGNGLCIYHIDESVTTENWSEWYPGHTSSGHYLVALEQADGQFALERSSNYGDQGDPYPGETNNRAFTRYTNPGSRDYSNAGTDVRVENVSNSDTVMTADLRVTPVRETLTAVRFHVITNHIIPTLGVSDSMGVIGSPYPLDWYASYRMHNTDADSTWECICLFDSAMKGDSIHFRFVVDRGNGEVISEVAAIRSVVLAGDTMDLPLVYFNNDSVSTPLSSPTVITFKVITNHIYPLLASTDSLGLRGSYPPLDWSTTMRLTNADGDSTWEGTVTFDQAYGGGTLSYKFVVEHTSDGFISWESGIDNRRILLNGETFSLQPVYFNDDSTTNPYMPIISVSPDSFDVAAVEGDDATQTITIANDGARTLNWSIGGLATTSPTAGSSPGTYRGEASRKSRMNKDKGESIGSYSRGSGGLSVRAPGATLVAVSKADPSYSQQETDGLTATLTELGYAYTLVSSVEEAKTAGASVLIIGYGSSWPDFSYTYSDLDNWVRSGKGVIQLGDYPSYFTTRVTNVDLYLEMLTVQVDDSSHPITRGLPGAWLTYGYWSGSSIAGATDQSSSDLASISAYSLSRVASATQIGLGRGVFIGINVYGSLAGQYDKMLFRNAIEWASGAVSDWLTASPSSGSIPAGGTQNVEVKASAAHLGMGRYYDDLIITSDDTIHNPISSTAVLTVGIGDRPGIQVDPEELRVTITGDSSCTLSFHIINVGTQPINFSTADTVSWLSETPSDGTVSPHGSALVGVTFSSAGLSPGVYATYVNVSSNDPFKPLIQVCATMVMLFSPLNVVAGTGFDGIVPLTWTQLGDIDASPSAGGDSLHTTAGRSPKSGLALMSGFADRSKDHVISGTKGGGREPSTNIDHYNIYRSASPGGPYSLIASPNTSVRVYSDNGDYIDSIGTNGVTNYYVVTAVSNGVETAYSEEVTATPTAGGQALSSPPSRTTTTIDGVISSSEWQDAATREITMPGIPNPVRMLVKNSRDTLFLAIEDVNNTSGNFDQLGVYLDANHDRMWDMYGHEGAFFFDFYPDSTSVYFRSITGSYPNVDPSNSWNPVFTGISAACSFSSGHFQGEIAFDLKSSYFGGTKDTLGLWLCNWSGWAASSYYWSYDGTWPYGSVYVAPLSYGDLLLSKEEDFTKTLQPSWNLVSWNVRPVNDSTISILSDVKNNLVVALGFDGVGLTYDPTVPSDFNTLNIMNYLHGYWLKTSSKDTLVLRGAFVNSQTRMDLARSWNLVSYLPPQPDSTAHALASVVDSLVVVQGFDGGALTYDPKIPPEFNTLKVIGPGFGYWLKMKCPDTLVYPPTQLIVPEPGKGVVSIAKVGASKPAVVPTRQWISVWGKGVRMDDHLLPVGTVIRAVDKDGVTCGEFVVAVEGCFGLMPIYADDPETDIDEGPKQGEDIHIYVGDYEVPTPIKWTEFGEVISFDPLLTALGGELRNIPTSFALHQNYPNPFNPTTTIKYDLPKDAFVSLKIYNVLGQEVQSLVNANQRAGYYAVQWSGVLRSGAAPSGLYFCTIQAGTYYRTIKMLLLK